jgi:hypothetical protein
MPTEQQPEEAATKPVAAAFSAAGSFTQTQMYVRGFCQTAQSTRAEVRPPADQQRPAVQPAEGQKPPTGAPSSTALEARQGEISDEVRIACSEQDSAAAQARIVRSQLPEPPSAVPLALDTGPGR